MKRSIQLLLIGYVTMLSPLNSESCKSQHPPFSNFFSSFSLYEFLKQLGHQVSFNSKNHEIVCNSSLYNNETIDTIFNLVAQHQCMKSGDNFHIVEDNKLYRSATLSRESLEKYIKSYAIKTILLLREPEVDAEWYKEEMVVAQKYGVNVIPVPLNVKKLPSKEEVSKLL